MDVHDARLRKIDLAAVTRIPARRVLDWTQRGWIVPVEKVEGQGKTSYYDATNAVEVLILDALSSSGVQPGRFAKYFQEPRWRQMFKFHTESFALADKKQTALVLDDTKEVFWLSHWVTDTVRPNPLPKEIVEGDFDRVVMVNVKRIVQRVRDGIARL